MGLKERITRLENALAHCRRGPAQRFVSYSAEDAPVLTKEEEKALRRAGRLVDLSGADWDDDTGEAADDA